MWKAYFEDDDNKEISFLVANTKEEIAEKLESWLEDKFTQVCEDGFGYLSIEQDWEWVSDYEVRVYSHVSLSRIGDLIYYIKEYKPENAFRVTC